jgi:aspartyl-tRNA(Asn)/glutamyl-tRNA(Gln) amidotransferase subunit B
MEFETVIGLEVHVQLNTETKLFCSCPTSFNEQENSNTCPTCLALPGALPTINREAVHKAIQFGKAVDAKINSISKFDRKNYFYPDSPSAYQISQFYQPIVESGYLDITGKRVVISRAHLEADAGKSIHESDGSKVDLNRAGTPLLEIVSAPDMRSSDEAIEYLKKLHTIIRYINISDANMQEGSFRCDANVSIRPKGDEKLYTRVEIKNINSFRFIQKAIEFEVARQREAWIDETYSKDVWQETRLYDSAKNETRSMRSKEEASDYRYFPEPDLLDINLSDEIIKKYSQIPELPVQKAERFQKDLGLTEYNSNVISSSFELARYFEELIQFGVSSKMATTWLTVELLGRLNKLNLDISQSPINSRKLSDLILAIDNNTISGKAGKDILDFLFENNISVSDAIKKLGLEQVSDDNSILLIIDNVIAQNSNKVAEYKSGKDKLFGFFVGQVIKQSGGSANPQKVNDLLKLRL